MRTRLSKTERREDILKKARQLFFERGLAGTEMEDIRLACGITRGGLYHHFSNKCALLDALVEGEVASLADELNAQSSFPIAALLRAGSSHLGSQPGIVSALKTPAEKLDYLSALDVAFTSVLRDPLSESLTRSVREGTNPDHVAELFLTITAHINRREILGDWSSAEAAGFAATSLEALAPFLNVPAELAPFISELKKKASSQ
jgi:AcrR family transcriptional regulator